MNNQQKIALVNQIEAAIRNFSANDTVLLGAQRQPQINTLAKQIVDSIRRVDFVRIIATTSPSQAVTKPGSQAFDPVKAAVHHLRQGDIEEAFWLTFLNIHCGKHRATKWKLVAELYGALGPQAVWTWQNISQNPDQFSNWLSANWQNLTGKFGNHRKYESLDTCKTNGTARVIHSYVSWIKQANDHSSLFNTMLLNNGNNPQHAFRDLYISMSAVTRFGRMAKFDYLTMVGKLGLCSVEPDKAYLAEATGPKQGMRLLVGNSRSFPLSNASSEAILARLGATLPIPSMVAQVMEDAICNWQKSPANYVYFSG